MINRRIVHALLLTSACMSLYAADPESVSWPRWRGPNGDGHSSETGIRKNWSEKAPNLEWMARGLGKGFASVSVADGRIYTTGNLGGQAVVCIDASDGSVVWTKKITDSDPLHGFDGSRSTPALDGENLYVVSSKGSIACLKQKDGEVVWTRDFSEWGGRMMSGWGFSESPLVDGDRVLCTPGGNDAIIVCLNKKTGKEIWKAAMPRFSSRGNDGAGYSSISVSTAAGIKQYVQLVGRGVISVRAKDGRFLWGYDKVANGTANIPTPVVFKDFVFASTAYDTGSALLKIVKTRKGAQAREMYFLKPKTLQNKHGGMVVVDDYLYCGHGNGRGLPICVDLSRGKVAWGPTRGPGRGEAAALYVDGHILYRFEDGVVALVKATPKSYQVVGSFKPEYKQGQSWAHPVVAGGKLYLREQDRLMCYNLK